MHSSGKIDIKGQNESLPLLIMLAVELNAAHVNCLHIFHERHFSALNREDSVVVGLLECFGLCNDV